MTFKRVIMRCYKTKNAGSVDDRNGCRMRHTFIGISNISTKFKSETAVEHVIVPFLNKCLLTTTIYKITKATIKRLKSMGQDLRS